MGGSDADNVLFVMVVASDLYMIMTIIIFAFSLFVERLIEIDENLPCVAMISRWRINVRLGGRRKYISLKRKKKNLGGGGTKITRDKSSVIRISF